MQKKLYLIAIAALLIGAVAVGWTYMQNLNETVPIMAPLVEANANEPQIPATVMTYAERQAVKEAFMSPAPYLFPNQYDDGPDEDATLFPANYKHLLSVPFHNSKNVIRVYTDVTCSVALNPTADCLGDDIVIVQYNATDKTSKKIASIASYQGSNNGGIFVPLALSADDKNIVLRAWMGSPGAGGGAVDYGYSSVPVATNNVTYATETLPRLASAVAIFYDLFGKVVSLEQSDKVYDWSQPGRNPNQGLIVYRDLVSGQTKTLADGADTTYEIRSFDENTRTLGVQQIRYYFGPDCPRSDKILDCANASATNTVIRLP